MKVPKTHILTVILCALILAGHLGCTSRSKKDNGNTDCSTHPESCASSSVCGNGIVEDGEVCDGQALPQSCSDFNFLGGEIACSSNCLEYQFDSCVPLGVCGNDIVEDGEVCDGQALPQSCSDFDFLGGEIACASDCLEYQFDSCLPRGICGNDIVEDGETCDGEAIPHFCQHFGFIGGDLTCKSDCLGYHFDACLEAPVCGNGIVEDGEVCDGQALPQSCEDFGFVGGEIACLNDCRGNDFDLCRQTAVCGDGLVEGEEACDGANLTEKTCTDFLYAGGVLACSNNCLSFDIQGCQDATTDNLCGNGVIEAPEVCDSQTLGPYDSEQNGGVCSNDCTGYRGEQSDYLIYQDAGNAGLLSSYIELQGPLFVTVLTPPLQAPLLQRVGGFISLTSNFFDRAAFPALHSIDGTLTVRNNNSLVNLDFGALETINDGSFELTHNQSLEEVNFPSLATISHNFDLGSYAGESLIFEALTEIGGHLTLTYNENLETIEFPALTRIGGAVAMHNNTGLLSAAFPNLSEFQDLTVTLVRASDLSFLDFAKVVSIPGSVEVSCAPESFPNTHFTALRLPLADSILGNLLVHNLYSFQNLHSPLLTTIGGNFSLESLESISTIHLESLATVGGSVSLTGMTSLQSIDLPSLEQIGGDLTIGQHNWWSDTGGVSAINLQSLTAVAGNIDINTPHFSTCTLLDLVSQIDVGGTVAIVGNGDCTNP